MEGIKSKFNRDAPFYRKTHFGEMVTNQGLTSSFQYKANVCLFCLEHIARNKDAGLSRQADLFPWGYCIVSHH